MSEDPQKQLVDLTRKLLEEYRTFGDHQIEVSRIVRSTKEVVNDIHVLVNSEKTAALERELRSAKRELILLKELGRPEKVIRETEQVVEELTQTLKDRAVAQAKVDSG